MASASRKYVPGDTTTMPTKRRHLSAFHTCIHSGVDKWKSIFRSNPYPSPRRSFLRRQSTQRVHFRRNSSFYSNPPTPTPPSPDKSNPTYRRSYSSPVPLKPILKSSAAYRNSLQSSRTAPSISTSRRSTSHDLRVASVATASRHSIAASRRSFLLRTPLLTSRRSSSAPRYSTSQPRPSFSTLRRSMSNHSPDSLDLALVDTHEVARNLVTMSATQSVYSIQARLTNFKKHLSHLSHRLTILNEAEAERDEARGRQIGLHQKYMDAVDRQTSVMNELALGVGREVDDVLGMRFSTRDGYIGYPSPAKSDDTGNTSDSDIERFLGRKIAFEPEDQRMGREIFVMDVNLRHTSIRNELEVLIAQMALETLDRAKLFKDFQKMSRDLKDEIDLVAEDRDGVQRLVRRHGGRSERKDFEQLVERFKVVREQYVERSDRLGEGWLAMDEKDFFKR